MANATCTAREGCDKPVVGGGLCRKHYMRKARTGTTELRPHDPFEPPDCNVEDCKKPARDVGYCSKHAQRWRKYGDPLYTKLSEDLTGEDLPGERWIDVPVPRFEGRYAVSSLMRIRSLPRDTASGRRGGMLLKPYLRDDGYSQVTLYGPGGKPDSQRFLVHELVALAFLGPRPTGMHIRHLDGDPGNSVPENLAYGSPSENMLDVKRHGRGFGAIERCPKKHLYDEENTRWYKGGRFCRACDRERSRERTVQAKHEDAPAKRHFSAAELATEIWAPVLGYEGYYDAGSLGRIRALEALMSIGGRGPRVLDANPSRRDAYPSVSLLSPDGTRKRFTVHSLVAEAFLGLRPEGMEVRHLDGNAHNAALSNLAYGSSGDNQRDKLRHGTHHYAKRNHCKHRHEYTPENTRIETHPDGSFKRRVCLQCETDRRRNRQATLREERAGKAA